MSYLRGVSRQQMMLLPESVEDYVGADNPVRVIDAFVDGLDLSALGFCTQGQGGAGRAAL
jgi:transposase